MSAPQFTPGPWHVADGGVVWVERPIPVAHQECCGNTLPSGECCGNGIEAWHEELAQEQVAQCSPTDAPLIAAAPKLYAALERVCDAYGFDASTDSSIWQEAFAALAEVRGEQ